MALTTNSIKKISVRYLEAFFNQLKLRQSNVEQEANAVINISHDYTQFHSCNLLRTKFQYW